LGRERKRKKEKKGGGKEKQKLPRMTVCQSGCNT